MSKNEIFSWGFKGGYQPTLKKKKKPYNHCFFQYRNMNYIYFNIQNPILVFTCEASGGGEGGRLDNLAAAFSFAKCSIAS